MATFVVKLRDLDARSWGDQVEVEAETAKEAAERIAGQPLFGSGDRAVLRARVWRTPFGSQPDVPFYVEA